MPELRILITTEVPADLFEQAEVIAKIATPLADFAAEMKNARLDAKVEHELGPAVGKKPTPRAPRSDAGRPRGPRVTTAPAAVLPLAEAAA